MFLTACSPMSSKARSSLSRTGSRTIRETQMPPGSASASSRAATLTPSPKMSSSSTMMSPRLMPTRLLQLGDKRINICRFGRGLRHDALEWSGSTDHSRNRGVKVWDAAAGSALAQLGVESIAQGVAEEADAEHGERDGEAREDRDPRRRGSVFLGAPLQHQAPGGGRLLHTEAEIRER